MPGREPVQRWLGHFQAGQLPYLRGGGWLVCLDVSRCRGGWGISRRASGRTCEVDDAAEAAQGRGHAAREAVLDGSWFVLENQ